MVAEQKAPKVDFKTLVTFLDDNPREDLPLTAKEVVLLASLVLVAIVQRSSNEAKKSNQMQALELMH